MGPISSKRQLGTGSDTTGTDIYGDTYDEGDGNSSTNWWFTGPGYAVRYAAVALLLGAVALFFIGGFYHAKRRLRQGKQPLRYHRWMVRNTYPTSAFTRYQTPAARNQVYAMEAYPPPPPAYNHEEMPPPGYQGSAGGSKLMEDQRYVAVQEQGHVTRQADDGSGIAMPAPVARQ